VLVVAGPGNNGGDGISAARHLADGGLEVELLLLADPDRLDGDPALEWRLAERFDVPRRVVSDDDLGAVEEALSPAPDVVVDAMLGTGLDRPLGGRLAEVAARIERAGPPVVAVDVPTGLSGSASHVPGPVLTADLTVTFAALKRCHVLPPACLHCGEVAVVDIGIPGRVLADDADLWWVEGSDVALMLPIRHPDGHKGRFGHLAILAGAVGRGGAAAMAGRAAVAAGTGLVTMAVPEPVVGVVDGACLEAMTLGLPADGDGAVAVIDALLHQLDRFTAVAMGPGIGTGDGARAAVETLVDRWAGTLILDADAINLLAGRPELLANRDGPTILTPHPGELGRLLGRSTDDVVADRLDAARDAAERARAVVVAKGYRTLIVEPGGHAWVNPTGDAHLGSGGSGDVLTGLIAGFAAQGLEPGRAAIVACWLHGRAGELGASRWPAAVPAAELPRWIADAWRELEEPV
jgi:NAD(P)H-hydrate epimerase